MKLKLGIVFIILSFATIYGVFEFNERRLSEQNMNYEPNTKINQSTVWQILSTNSWVNYSDKAIHLPNGMELAKKNVFIHLWASWCAPCLNEIPELITYAQKNKQTAKFILVSLDESSEELAKFLKSFPELNDILFLQIWDKEGILSKKFNADRLPMTMLLKPEEKEVKAYRSVVDWKSL